MESRLDIIVRKGWKYIFSLKRVKWILSRVLGGHLNVQSILCFSSTHISISRLGIVANRHCNDDGMEEKALPQWYDDCLRSKCKHLSIKTTTKPVVLSDCSNSRNQKPDFSKLYISLNYLWGKRVERSS